MYVVVRLIKSEELKAIAILLRHSPGTVLPNGTYIISPKRCARPECNSRN